MQRMTGDLQGALHKQAGRTLLPTRSWLAWSQNSQLHHSRTCTLAPRAGSTDPGKLRPTITSSRPPRQSTPLPEQIPVEHSATYLLRSKRPTEEDEGDSLPSASGRDKEPFTGNAVQWYLQRLDKSMDEADGAPPAAAKTYYNVVQSPAGSSAAKGVASAMGTAIKLSAGAVKAAAPVGKWALMQGLGAAGKLISGASQSADANKEDKSNH